MSFTLRDYQDDLIGKARAELQAGTHSVLMVAPTGAGKTALAAFMLGTASSRRKRCWFMVHRRELVTQSSRTFDKVGIPHGIISSGFSADPRMIVQIASVQTLARRLHNIPAPDMIVWDECHHIASESWAQIFSMFPSAIHIGLTATPCRLDGRGLGDWFDVLVEGPTTKWLIENKFLSPYRLFSAPPIDLSGVKSRGGDFIPGQIAERVDKPHITGDAIAHYSKYCPGAPNIVFTANIQHSMHIVEQYNAAGFQAAHLDGKTDRKVRDQMLRDFERGNLKVLSNVDLFGEGFDVPGIVAVTQLRPTASTGLDLQQKGRGLRTADGKQAAFLFDHVGNWVRHGPPDEVREWSLDAKPKTKRERDEEIPKLKQCDACYAVHEPAPQCPYCGNEYQVVTRKVELRDGELVEMSADMMARAKKQEQSKAKSLTDLITLATARKYKNPSAWAKHVYNARQRKSA